MDTTGNLLTSLRNAELAQRSTTLVPATKLNRALLDLLSKRGYVTTVADTDNTKLEVGLVAEATHHFKRISKPGRRLYVTVEEIPTIRQGLGMVILSTSKGLLSGQDAKKQRLGGELLCEVY